MIWSQSLRGRAIDMIHPRPGDVDFDEIAETLSRIPRFNGCCSKPLSVAQHTLIAAAAAPRWLVPWALLHDAHEARIGDITTPTAEALAELADMAVAQGGTTVRIAIGELKKRHDIAIHAAAGVPMPVVETREAIKLYDLIALRTERRDFMAPSPRAWNPAEERVAPLKQTFKPRPVPDVAAELAAAFRAELPCFRR